ncbi:Holliday junction resolvase RecU [Alkalibacter mobilis]|uniref:Holliday junction resolvase RecU n=1 Tax=Alkalibacter mobilis TaxID=2787712 RepID=UPI00189FCCB2|nr:Holliday junction resolvase RecU [Alkalibacter mobilis]MBF7096538.1 Holliday junction resolvase RecU [Alkalibacter mobilis]
MPYWNSRGLRGSTLEEFVNLTNEEYMRCGLAVIQKLPTAIKPIRLDQEKGIINLAYFEQKSTVDYMGNIQGIPVCFDVKETGKDSLPISNIHEHQLEFMEKFRKQNGLAYIIVRYSKIDRCFLIPFEEIKRYWDDAARGGRKSIPWKSMNIKYEIKREGTFLLHYLKAVNEYLKDCE